MERYDANFSTDYQWYEHWHRYHFIKSLVKGKVVADIACGEGYGSSLLASVAKTVTGIDLDKNTIELAQEKYSSHSNLNYLQSNALDLNINDDCFDVVVSFETLEHLYEHQELLEEFKRVLKPDGLLIISTPDKDVYSEENDHNHYHVKELTKIKFATLVDSHFKYSQTYGQQFQLMSVIEKIDSKQDGSTEYKCAKKSEQQDDVDKSSQAKYLIKVCTNDSESIQKIDLVDWHGFNDDENSLFHHYEQQIKNLILMDQHNLQLKETLEKQAAYINHLKARLGY